MEIHCTRAYIRYANIPVLILILYVHTYVQYVCISPT